MVTTVEWRVVYSLFTSEPVHDIVAIETRNLRSVTQKLKDGFRAEEVQNKERKLLGKDSGDGEDLMAALALLVRGDEFMRYNASTSPTKHRNETSRPTQFAWRKHNSSQTALAQSAVAEESPAPLIVTEENRSIVLVHVGKAGGTTIRNNIVDLNCYRASPEKRGCTRYYRNNLTLPVQTLGVFHMWHVNEAELREATSFLVTLRNPVDRVISAYRYGHPKNCQGKVKDTWGCTMIEMGLLSKPKFLEYRFYEVCFPEPGAEDFAQALLPPWQSTEAFEKIGDKKKYECRRMARRVARGDPVGHVSKHMKFNYNYYAWKSLLQFPEKEVLAVRTEQEWEDLIHLDKFIGGSGQFKRAGRKHSWGSSNYLPSPVSTEAYHKLCCVLKDEIGMYLYILNQASNLDEAARKESEDSLREKCGVQVPWSTWRDEHCQPILDEAEAEVQTQDY